MTQLISVSMAVSGELTRKCWWPPRNLDATMGETYHYDADSVTAFLLSVRHLLETAISEAYTFQFDAVFAKEAVGMTVSDLIAAIDEKATPLASPALFQAAAVSARSVMVVSDLASPPTRPRPRKSTGKSKAASSKA